MKRASIDFVKILADFSVFADEMLNVQLEITLPNVIARLISEATPILFVLKHHPNVPKIQNVYLDTFVKIHSVFLAVDMTTTALNKMLASMVSVKTHAT